MEASGISVRPLVHKIVIRLLKSLPIYLLITIVVNDTEGRCRRSNVLWLVVGEFTGYLMSGIVWD